MAGDDELLDLDTGMLSAATQQFSSGLNAFKSSMANAGTVWNGQASELLNLPLSATIVEALTVDQIEGWGAKGNVRMLLGVLNTVIPETNPPSDASARLKGHRDTALRVILGRGAKSLDALVLSLSLNLSERIVEELDDMVQQAGDPTARGGALAAMQMLAETGGSFGRNIAAMLTEKRLHKIPSLSDVKSVARERGAAASVIRVEAVLATHEKDRADLQTNCQRLIGLADSVVNGPDGPAIRIRHIPTVSAGFEDLRQTYSTRMGRAADGTSLTADLLRLQRVTALFDSPELSEVMGLLEDLWLTVLQDHCAFVVTESGVAVALSDRANFKGLPVHVAATERLALLAQAGAELSGMTEALNQEIEEIDRTMVGLATDSPIWQRKRTNRTAITAHLEDVWMAADAVLQAIEAYEGAIRTEEAMFRKRVGEIETFAQGVTGTVESLLTIMPSPGWPDPSIQASLDSNQAELVTAIRSFAVVGGTYSRLGGLRMVAAAIEGIAALVEGLDFAQPGRSGAHRSAVTAALGRAQSSGMVRQREVEAVMLLLAAVDPLC